MPTAERRALEERIQSIIREYVFVGPHAFPDGRLRGVSQAAGLILKAAEEATLRDPHPEAERVRVAEEAMRERCADVVEAHTYKGQGTEGRNDLIGMFARGQMRCKQAVTRAIRALPLTGDRP